MKSLSTLSMAMIGTAASVNAAQALSCTYAALKKVLPAGASLNNVTPLHANYTFKPPSNDAFPLSPTGLPELCYVNVQQTFSGNTTYNYALFLPRPWNGRFLATGGAGFGGGINYQEMGVNVKYGFAVVSTDYGHNSSTKDATWAYQNAHLQNLWGFYALHEAVVQGKAITQSYYNKPIDYSYYSGCSTGGRMGMKEVELYPNDFDGVLAGSAAWWTGNGFLEAIYIGIANLYANGSLIIPASLTPVVAAEAVRQCDGQDGLVDGIISDPLNCKFNMSTLLCTGSSTPANNASCITPIQLSVLNTLYADWVINGTLANPGLPVGSELQWLNVNLAPPIPNAQAVQYVQEMMGLGPDWSWTQFNDSLVALSNQLNPGQAQAANYDISPFQKAGGKLLTYHGWADARVPPQDSVYYYEKSGQIMASKKIVQSDFHRLFMIPGMQHCFSTPPTVNAPWYLAGAYQSMTLDPSLHSVPGFSDPQHDILLALMSWVENGTAPAQIVATKWVNDTTHDTVLRQRPVCPYPQVAKYSGTGSVDAAASWGCVAGTESVI